MINRLHKARVASKQGEKLTRNQSELRKEALRAAKWNEKARELGLRGEKRLAWVGEKMKWQGDVARKLSRALQRIRK